MTRKEFLKSHSVLVFFAVLALVLLIVDILLMPEGPYICKPGPPISVLLALLVGVAAALFVRFLVVRKICKSCPSSEAFNVVGVLGGIAIIEVAAWWFLISAFAVRLTCMSYRAIISAVAHELYPYEIPLFFCLSLSTILVVNFYLASKAGQNLSQTRRLLCALGFFVTALVVVPLALYLAAIAFLG